MKYLKTYEEDEKKKGRYWILLKKHFKKGLREIAKDIGEKAAEKLYKDILDWDDEDDDDDIYYIITEEFDIINKNKIVYDFIYFTPTNVSYMKRKFEYMGKFPEFYDSIEKYNL